jgi:hypothetical protein
MAAGSGDGGCCGSAAQGKKTNEEQRRWRAERAAVGAERTGKSTFASPFGHGRRG